MNIHRLVLSIVLATTWVGEAYANPTFDMRQWVNDLPRSVVRNASKGNEEALARVLGWGLDDMQLSTLEYMDDHFERLKGVIVRSQRPPYGVSLPLQSWYRSRARETDRKAMIESLRLWIAVPLELPPLEGWFGETPKQTPEDYSVQAAQGRAAEALADWGDRESLPTLEKLLLQFRDHGPDWRHASYVPADGVERAIRRLRTQP